jgi:hypothetical protein
MSLLLATVFIVEERVSREVSGTDVGVSGSGVKDKQSDLYWKDDEF